MSNEKSYLSHTRRATDAYDGPTQAPVSGASRGLDPRGVGNGLLTEKSAASEVFDEVELLNNHVGTLQNSINEFEKMLDAVLVPSEPTTEAATPRGPKLTPLGGRLGAINTGLCDALDHLYQLKRRLAL